MADRRHIESMIKRKEQEVLELNDRIKEATIYLQALQDVLKRFPKSSDDITDAASSLRSGSAVAQARDAILAAGRPMHVDEILRHYAKELTRHNRTTLGGSLSAYVRKGMIFTRTAPNTFGLVELVKARNVVTEPPDDFGVERVVDEEF